MEVSYLIEVYGHFPPKFYNKWGTEFFSDAPLSPSDSLQPFQVFSYTEGVFGPFEYDKNKKLWVPNVEYFWMSDRPNVIEFYKQSLNDDHMLRIIEEIPPALSKSLKKTSEQIVSIRNQISGLKKKLDSSTEIFDKRMSNLKSRPVRSFY